MITAKTVGQIAQRSVCLIPWRINSRRTCPARLSHSAAAFAALLIHGLSGWCECSGGP